MRYDSSVRRIATFVALVFVVAAALVVAPSAEAHHVVAGDAGTIGAIADTPDGAPWQTTGTSLDDRLKRARSCGHGGGIRTVFFELAFASDGHLRSSRILNGKAPGDGCVLAAFEGAIIVRPPGAPITVMGYVQLG